MTQASNKSLLIEQAQVSQSVTKAGHTVIDSKRVGSAMVHGSKRETEGKGWVQTSKKTEGVLFPNDTASQWSPGSTILD